MMEAILFLKIFIVLAMWEAVEANECNDERALRIVNGTVELLNDTYTIAGGLQVCVNSSWITVCGLSWDPIDATVACQQLGLSFISSCGGSCFGNKNISNPGTGFNNFMCTGSEPQLLNCSHGVNSGCVFAAGLTCAINSTSLNTCETEAIDIMTTTEEETLSTTLNEDTSTSTSESSIVISSGSQATRQTALEQQGVRGDTVALALGVVAGVLAVALVIVIIILIVTCIKLCKAQNKSSLKEKSLSMDNIVYDVTETSNSEALKSQPHEGYSRINRPTGNSKKLTDLEDNYDVVPSNDDPEQPPLYSVPYKKNKAKNIREQLQTDNNVEENQTTKESIYNNVPSSEYGTVEPKYVNS